MCICHANYFTSTPCVNLVDCATEPNFVFMIFKLRAVRLFARFKLRITNFEQWLNNIAIANNFFTNSQTPYDQKKYD